VRGFLRERRDTAQNFSGAERHLDATAHIHLGGKAGRDRIIEFLSERDFKADTGNHS
jgi:hypothetical protein